MKKLICLIDFDGTCTTHEFPAIGKDIGAAPVLRELVTAGHQLILWTMRCDHTEPPITNDPDIHPHGGNYLSEAVKWFKDRDIPLYGINTNPTQSSWTSSPKAYGTLCLDDINLGSRLMEIDGCRPFINWPKTYEDLCEKGVLVMNGKVWGESYSESLKTIESYM